MLTTLLGTVLLLLIGLTIKPIFWYWIFLVVWFLVKITVSLLDNIDRSYKRDTASDLIEFNKSVLKSSDEIIKTNEELFKFNDELIQDNKKLIQDNKKLIKIVEEFLNKENEKHE